VTAGFPSRTRAAEPNNAAGAEAFINSLLRDPEVQQLLQAVANGISPSTKEQLEQAAQLAVSGATPEEPREQFRLIVSSLPEPTQADIDELVFRLFSVAGIGLMAGAIAKFKQHKNNPQQVHARNAVAQLFHRGRLDLYSEHFFYGWWNTLWFRLRLQHLRSSMTPMLEIFDYVLLILVGLCAFTVIVILSLGKPPRNPVITPKKTKHGNRDLAKRT